VSSGFCRSPDRTLYHLKKIEGQVFILHSNQIFVRNEGLTIFPALCFLGRTFI
jgi:hypothetical protein